MAEYLVRLGIDSMSLNPDTVLKTTQQVLDIEALCDNPSGRPSDVAAAGGTSTVIVR